MAVVSTTIILQAKIAGVTRIWGLILKFCLGGGGGGGGRTVIKIEMLLAIYRLS